MQKHTLHQSNFFAKAWFMQKHKLWSINYAKALIAQKHKLHNYTLKSFIALANITLQ